LIDTKTNPNSVRISIMILRETNHCNQGQNRCEKNLFHKIKLIIGKPKVFL
jgi:hypothetical protein